MYQLSVTCSPIEFEFEVLQKRLELGTPQEKGWKWEPWLYACLCACYCRVIFYTTAIIPEGNNIADVIDDIPDELKISAFYSRGNTQRLSRNLPVPTLVPGHSNFPIHPWEHRSITVREAATITGFPLNYKFCGSHTSRCVQIGNAVPVHLSYNIALSIKKLLLDE